MEALTAGLSRYRRTVLVMTGLVVAVAGLLSLGLQSHLSSGWSDFDDPGSSNVKARQVITQATGVDPQQGYVLLVRTPERLNSAQPPPPSVRAAVEILHGRPEVREVLDYASGRMPGLISEDGHVAAVYARTGPLIEKDVFPDLRAEIDSNPNLAGRVVIGGPTAASVQMTSVVVEDLARAEMIVFPCLFVLLIIVFRGLVAALLPLLGGVITVVLTTAAMRAIVEVTSLSVYSLNLALALGLGVSIDFSLLIISRYREQLRLTGAGAETLRVTMATAGRTVLFSGLTIASAVTALLVFPQRQLHSMGIAGILVTVAALLYAFVVLPAILAVLGPRVEAGAPRRWHRRTWGPHTSDPAAERWRRIAERVITRPGMFAAAATLVLLALASPLAGVKFTGVQSATVLPDNVSAGAVSRALAADFPSAPADEEQLLIEAAANHSAAVTAFAIRLREIDGIAAITSPRMIDDRHWLVSITLAGQPLSPQAQSIMRAVSDIDADVQVHPTGPTADALALNTSLASHLPAAAFVLIAATLVMLFAMTGSVVLPLKAVAMNVLSIGAALGILVAVFQHGILASLFGATAQGALESTTPIILVAVAFGLSTDYGVFLLGRIKEVRDHGASDREAIVAGVEHTGRIVTSAAALFCLAMSALLFSRLDFIKELGLGAALAVLIDATIVRAVLVPSLMTMLGNRNWWSPAPLRRLHALLWPTHQHLSRGSTPGSVEPPTRTSL